MDSHTFKVGEYIFEEVEPMSITDEKHQVNKVEYITIKKVTKKTITFDYCFDINILVGGKVTEELTGTQFLDIKKKPYKVGEYWGVKGFYFKTNNNLKKVT